MIWVLLASPAVLREPFRRRDGVAVTVAFGGMLLFFVGKFESRGFAGEIFALASSLFFAILVLSLRRERGAAAEAVVTCGNVLAALAILPFVCARPRGHDDVRRGPVRSSASSRSEAPTPCSCRD